MKRILGKFVFVVFLVAFVFLLPQKTEVSFAAINSTETENFTNLIVFCKFSGEDEFINDEYNNISVKQITENSYSLADYSVKNYYQTVSNGKVNIQNVYLFSEGGGSLTLSKPRGYYCSYDETSNPLGYATTGEKQLRMSDLKQDWADAINQEITGGGMISDLSGAKNYDISDLDKNNDGYIDSVTIIYKFSSDYNVSASDCLWNYQSFSDRVELLSNAKTITSGKYVQFTANYDYLLQDKNGVVFSNLKTMIHEMGHVFGLYDLYKTENNSPVYYMSAMAKAISYVPQYISAKERESLGWLDSSNISVLLTSGTYTIDVTASVMPTSVVCYKYEIPNLNKTLYLEYRKFNGTENKYDTQEKNLKNVKGEDVSAVSGLKSGLVCFLATTGVDFPSNLYVTGNNWQYEVLGGEQSTKIDSAVGAGESLAVTSNLMVEVLSMNENSLTFKITGSDIPEVHTHNLTHINAVDADCVNTGNIEYWKCSTCNKYFSDELASEEIPSASTIINATEHNLTHINAVDADCVNTGNIEYWKCTACNKYFSDELTSDEIDLVDTIIAKKGHRKSEWIVEVEPTENNLGSKYKKCLDCGSELERAVIEYESTEVDNPSIDDDLPQDNTDDNSNNDGVLINSDNDNTLSIIVIISIVVTVTTCVFVVAGIIFYLKKKR